MKYTLLENISKLIELIKQKVFAERYVSIHILSALLKRHLQRIKQKNDAVKSVMQLVTKIIQ